MVSILPELLTSRSMAKQLFHIFLPLLLSFDLTSSTNQDIAQKSKQISAKINCEALNSISYVKTLKTLARDLLRGKAIDPSSVKFNLTKCFFAMNTVQELLLQMNQYYKLEELPQATGPYVRQLCDVSARCLNDRGRLLDRILNDQEQSIRKLAKITYEDALCYLEKYECLGKFSRLAGLSNGAITHGRFLFIVIGISSFPFTNFCD